MRAAIVADAGPRAGRKCIPNSRESIRRGGTDPRQRHPANQRALEIWRLTGRAMTEWQAARIRSPFPFRVLKLVVAPDDRALLHDRIAQRFDAMLDAGLIEEVARLRTDPASIPTAFDACRRYRQTWQYLDGDGDRATLRARGIAATRQLAKRQLTWLRSQFDARWFDPMRQGRDSDRAVALFSATALDLPCTGPVVP